MYRKSSAIQAQAKEKEIFPFLLSFHSSVRGYVAHTGQDN